MVILNSVDYYAKLDQIIEDSTKFTLIQANDNVHPVISKEQSIKYYIHKYLKPFGEETVRQLLSSGFLPGKLYGQIKTHKPGNPARPVILIIGSPEYELEKFLDYLIKPYIPTTYMLRSSQEFAETLKNFQFKPTHKLVSFDVKSLFTNLPLEETIDIIANTIYADDTNILPIPISKEVFKKLMFMATQGIFMYNDKLYKQVDGVTMVLQLLIFSSHT